MVNIAITNLKGMSNISQIIRPSQLLEALQGHTQQCPVPNTRSPSSETLEAFPPCRRTAGRCTCSISGVMRGYFAFQVLVAADHLFLAYTLFERDAVDDFLQLSVYNGVVVGDATDECDGVTRSCGVSVTH